MKRFLTAILVLSCAALAQSTKWTEKEATDWYAKQPWLVGSNYIPSYAINQLEMWQAASFNPVRIEMELTWAEQLGMNTMRVFLHHMLWQQDPGGFKRRIDKFLDIAKKHKIRPMFVLFDSCWDPFPQLGIQRAPRPGVHNSGWVQSPGATALTDVDRMGQVLTYAQEIVQAFANDDRILAWDIWNEPDNTNGSSYGKSEPANKLELIRTWLPKAFEYARAGIPSQPLTTGLWHGDWSPEKMGALEKMQIDLSDVVSFHSYDPPEEFEKRVKWLEDLHRGPILCTEYMARPRGSTFQAILPIAKQHKVAMYNWGFVAGKTQTFLPWDSWQNPYVDHQPAVWFHDIFTAEGKPYRPEETAFIREITASANGKAKGKGAGK